jgi:hypothetical protein
MDPPVTCMDASDSPTEAGRSRDSVLLCRRRRVDVGLTMSNAGFPKRTCDDRRSPVDCDAASLLPSGLCIHLAHRVEAVAPEQDDFP